MKRTDWKIRIDYILRKYKISDRLKNDLIEISLAEGSNLSNLLAKKGKYSIRANYGFRYQCLDFRPDAVTKTQVCYTNMHISNQRFINLMETGDILFAGKKLEGKLDQISKNAAKVVLEVILGIGIFMLPYVGMQSIDQNLYALASGQREYFECAGLRTIKARKVVVSSQKKVYEQIFK